MQGIACAITSERCRRKKMTLLKKKEEKKEVDVNAQERLTFVPLQYKVY